jgi:hypothetical protein
MAAFLTAVSSNRHAGVFARMKRIISALYVHPDAISYLCNDSRPYEAVEDSACGICGNLERLAEAIDGHDCFGFVDNQIHNTACNRSAPRVIPPVQLHADSSGKSDTTAGSRPLWVDAVSLLGASIPTLREGRTVESKHKPYN